MATNQPGLEPVTITPEQAAEVCAKYSGLTAEQISLRMRPPAPPPARPLTPRRLPCQEIKDRLAGVEASLARLERAKGRPDFDSRPLENEIRSNLQLLAGEFNGVIRDVKSGLIPGLVDAAFFVRERRGRLLLTDLSVCEGGFLSVARRTLTTLQDWPIEFPSPDPVCQAGGS